ncbi:Hypothetical protein NTJ_15773 [Nesidiocoris tenuis]|uniref:Enoyl-CoA delta isomerase 2, mitochondrial n=1 Tax=Nesidiocoris tenuis TaxID=355587 RepID=A0ABN7BF05_9HEMI|nr:Hypothetical protein NTJ_15773 [Nesidiocoris tenuis]
MSESLIITYEDGLQIIKFNRPKKLNSITLDVDHDLIAALDEAVRRDDVKITVLTGEGQYFTAGNDFSAPSGEEDMEGTIRKSLAVFGNLISVLIEHPKILVAIVNGPSVGVGVTMLSHFDVIYAHEKATFHTPFSSLGLCAEGCSSYLFPRILGKSLAAKMLYFNYKMSAKEAADVGFVAQTYNQDTIGSIWQDLKAQAKLPIKSLMATKRLMRMPEIPKLKAINRSEIEVLTERFLSEDFFNALMAMLAKRNKSKL